MDKRVIIVYRERDALFKENMIQAVKKAWEDRGYVTEKISVLENLPWEKYLPCFQNGNVLWLVTIDMAGFGWSTLLEGSAYNLLHIRQLHLLTQDRGQYDEFLRKEYAINLFFFTDNPETVKDWERKYPLLPHLGLMKSQKHLEDVVDEVIRYTETAGCS